MCYKRNCIKQDQSDYLPASSGRQITDPWVCSWHFKQQEVRFPLLWSVIWQPRLAVRLSQVSEVP